MVTHRNDDEPNGDKYVRTAADSQNDDTPERREIDINMQMTTIESMHGKKMT